MAAEGADRLADLRRADDVAAGEQTDYLNMTRTCGCWGRTDSQPRERGGGCVAAEGQTQTCRRVAAEGQTQTRSREEAGRMAAEGTDRLAAAKGRTCGC